MVQSSKNNPFVCTTINFSTRLMALHTGATHERRTQRIRPERAGRQAEARRFPALRDSLDHVARLWTDPRPDTTEAECQSVGHLFHVDRSHPALGDDFNNNVVRHRVNAPCAGRRCAYMAALIACAHESETPPTVKVLFTPRILADRRELARYGERPRHYKIYVA